MPLPFLAPLLIPGAAKAMAVGLVKNAKFWIVVVLLIVLTIFALKVRHDLLEQGRLQGLAQGRQESARVLKKAADQLRADGESFREYRGVFQRITARAQEFKAEQAAAFERGKAAGHAAERADRLVRERDQAFANRLRNAAKRSERCKALLELDLTAQLQECGLR